MREGIGASDRQQTLGPSTLTVPRAVSRMPHLHPPQAPPTPRSARAAQQGVDRQVRTACGRAIDASLLTSHAHIDMPTVWRLSYLWLQRSSDSTKWYLVARSRSRAQWVEASNKSYERSLPPRTHRHARGWSSLVEMGNAVCLHSCQLVSESIARRQRPTMRGPLDWLRVFGQAAQKPWVQPIHTVNLQSSQIVVSSSVVTHWINFTYHHRWPDGLQVPSRMCNARRTVCGCECVRSVRVR